MTTLYELHYIGQARADLSNDAVIILGSPNFGVFQVLTLGGQRDACLENP